MGHLNRSLYCVGVVCGVLLMPSTMSTVSLAASSLSLVDTDNDKTIDLTEAKAAASKLFDELDKDKEGTLDVKELKGRLSKSELSAGDLDHDKTLTKDEYLAIVEKAFKAADQNGDGTVDAKELKMKAGRALLRLLR